MWLLWLMHSDNRWMSVDLNRNSLTVLHRDKNQSSASHPHKPCVVQHDLLPTHALTLSLLQPLVVKVKKASCLCLDLCRMTSKSAHRASLEKQHPHPLCTWVCGCTAGLTQHKRQRRENTLQDRTIRLATLDFTDLFCSRLYRAEGVHFGLLSSGGSCTSIHLASVTDCSWASGAAKVMPAGFQQLGGEVITSRQLFKPNSFCS